MAVVGLSRWQLVIRSLTHYRALSLAVTAAVAVATLVLSGALIVGDSVRGSLRDIVLDRLGTADLVLISDRFFRPAIVEPLLANEPNIVVQRGCILPQVTIEAQNTLRRRRDVFLSAWEVGVLVEPLATDEIIINQPLADELNVRVGDLLLLRLPETTEVPADSPLGRKDGLVQSRGGLRIKSILPPTGAGRFSLSLHQQSPRNAFVAISTLQQVLGVEDRINAVTIGGTDRQLDASDAARLTRLLTPDLSDFGIVLERVEGRYQSDGEPHVAWASYQLTCDRMIWDDAVRETVRRALGDQYPQEVFTYLANSLELRSERSASIPYSTIAAMDAAGLALFEDSHGDALEGLRDDEIALNSWAAQDLAVRLGDLVTVYYFEPETQHGQTRERSQTFRLAAIVPVVTPVSPFGRSRDAEFERPPSRANDPQLTPTVKGVTDQDSIDDWDPPFPFDPQRVRRVDDEYWSQFRATPKAFITLAAGRELWSSRFGTATAIRVTVDGHAEPNERPNGIGSIEQPVLAALRDRQAELGFAFQPIKQQGLIAATGTTSFAVLFLGFSFFLIAASLMLIAILIRLGVQLRAREVGLLQAVGWSNRLAARQLVRESLLTSVAGASTGAIGAIGFAAILLWLLRTWWVQAIAVPFVKLHVHWSSLAWGIVMGTLLGWVVGWWTVRGLRKVGTTMLLRGEVYPPTGRDDAPFVSVKLAWLLLLAAVGMALAGGSRNGIERAGMFFGSGAALLLGLLLQVRFRLSRRHSRGERGSEALSSFLGFAARGLGRQSERSTLTIGLVSAATFLIIAVAAFRLQPTESGTGGFDWIGRMDRPLFVDLNDSRVQQRELGLELEREATSFALMRVHAGDDASCRNLYRVGRPQILGVTPSFVAACRSYPGSFAWAAVEPAEESESAATGDGGLPTADAWDALHGANDGDTIPVVLDLNTAVYSLHLKGRIGEVFSFPDNPSMKFRIVGLLSNTILQGSLLISEAAFEKSFPDVAGYAMVFVRAAAADRGRLRGALERRFSDEGLELRDTVNELSDLLAIQNTYLSTFQTVGALGLLLGTLGLAVVQMRSVIERRGELALMSTLGFTRRRLAWLLACETAFLLGLGLGIGIVSAAIAVMPHWWHRQASLPLASLLIMLASIGVSGLLASMLVVRAIWQLPVLATLRREGI